MRGYSGGFDQESLFWRRVKRRLVGEYRRYFLALGKGGLELMGN